MSRLATYRIAGYITCLVVHLGNFIVMEYRLRTTKDTRMKDIEAVQMLLFTIWNILIQITYSLFGLICDMRYKKGNITMMRCFRYREIVFQSIVWPCTMLIMLTFWPVFFINRDLLYQSFIDDTLPVGSNLIMHLFIFVVCLLELKHLPNKEKVSHKRNLIITSFVYIFYLTCAITFYHTRGLWPYPVVYQIYGTFYFPIAIVLYYLVMLLSYSILWYFNKFFTMKVKKSN
ncbi:androgen-dependent TFPI-regulating protein-like isoform 1-T2 [Aphomia sociella]